MIGKLSGKLIELEGNIGLVETVSGLSYEIYLTSSILTTAKLDKKLEVYTYLQIRDDAHVLYGFQTKSEQKLFKMLISISGVGPRSAFSIISFTKEQELIDSVKANDVAYLSQIPGLGRKTAMKIILELSQKLDTEFNLEKMYLSDDDKTTIEALISLGFKSQQAKTIVSKLPKNLTVEEKIKKALQLSTK